MINVQLLHWYPDASQTARNWIGRIPDCKWIEDHFAWLNKQLQSLDRKQQKSILDRLLSSRDDQYHEAIAELVYAGFWDHLEWKYQKDPSVSGKTPDFQIYPGETNSFFCDVTVLRHNHPHVPQTLDDLKNNKIILPAVPIEQEHRVLMKVEEKLSKYQDILESSDSPFVLGLYIYDDTDFFIDQFQIQTALFGYLTCNFSTDELHRQPKTKRTRHGEAQVGVFSSDKYKRVSAVIVCVERFPVVSNEVIQHPKPHRPCKAKYSLSFFINPLGIWGDGNHTDPFSSASLRVNKVVGQDQLSFVDPEEIEFYR